MKKGEGGHLLRAGIALLVGLAAVLLVMVLLGKSRSLFVSKVRLHTSFANISGLVVGAPVRLAGVDVGFVQAIRFNPDLRVKDVHVVLSLQGRYLERVREDSVARLSSKGLLGDMIINISVGSAELPALRDGATIKAEESKGLTEVAESVQQALAEVQQLAGDLDKRVKAVLSDEVSRDLGRAARSSANLIEKIEKGDGVLHALIYQPSLARDATLLLAAGRSSAERLNGALLRVDHVLAALESGQGTLHALIYGGGGGQLLADVQQAVHEISAVVTEVRSGDGLLHGLVYDEDAAQLVKDLSVASRVVRTLAEETQQGKGTVGGLLKDPTVYEDLKTTLGNVTRNRFLKALIRFTIKKDGLKRTAAAPGP